MVNSCNNYGWFTLFLFKHFTQVIECQIFWERKKCLVDVRECSKYGKCILATSCHRKNAQAVLDRTGLNEFIHEIITTNELGVNKDTPDIYLECAKHLNIDIHDCYVFEDVVTAIKAARKANFHVISINDKMWEKEKNEIIKYSSRNIDSFKELLDEMVK